MKKCPKCDYVRQAGDAAPDYECPKCGVVYAKFEEAQKKVQRELQETPKPPPQPQQSTPAPAPTRSNTARVAKCEDCGGLVSRMAVSCVHCGRPFGGDEDARSAPVSVVDVRMNFWSMVIFMVKWTIAAIPAAVILVLVVMLVFGVLGGALVGLR